jgi:hypothetical protein
MVAIRAFNGEYSTFGIRIFQRRSTNAARPSFNIQHSTFNI